jgi:hypothetical protein
VAVRFLLDADMPKARATALRRKSPPVEVRRVQEVGLRTAADEAILEFAARDGRIVVSRDKATMRRFATERIKKAEPMRGLLVVRRDFAIGGIGIGVLASELELIASATDPSDWEGVIQFIPFLGA